MCVTASLCQVHRPRGVTSELWVQVLSAQGSESLRGWRHLAWCLWSRVSPLTSGNPHFLVHFLFWDRVSSVAQLGPASPASKPGAHHLCLPSTPPHPEGIFWGFLFLFFLVLGIQLMLLRQVHYQPMYFPDFFVWFLFFLRNY